MPRMGSKLYHTPTLHHDRGNAKGKMDDAVTWGGYRVSRLDQMYDTSKIDPAVI